MSFKTEKKDRKKQIETFLFLFSFFLFVLALVIRVRSLLRNGLENQKSQLKILRELRSLWQKSSSLARLPLAPCTSKDKPKECPAEKVSSIVYYILIPKVLNLSLFNQVLVFLGTCRKNLPFRMDSLRKVFTMVLRR